MKREATVGAEPSSISGPAASSSIGLEDFWAISFPSDTNLRNRSFKGSEGNEFGVATYRFSKHEARFLLRGEFAESDELNRCLEQATAFARELGCSDLVTQEKIRADWVEAKALFRANGFRQIDESWIFECSFSALSKRINRIMQLLQRRRTIPDNVHITDLNSGRALVRAILDEALLMDGFDFDHRLTAGGAKRISAANSQLVWQNELLLGIILVAPTGVENVYEIPIRFVAADARRSWVNALLIYSCVRQGESSGAETIRFNANADAHKETILLAEQAGGSHVATSNRYQKAVG